EGERGADVPARTSTVYRIGSVTKQFTSALVMREAEAGKLALDDSVQQYVPGFDTHGERVTLRELLTLTGGVPNYTSDSTFERRMTLDLPDSAVLAMGERDSLDFEPGTRWSYSNTDYYLLGLVLEKVTGRPYGELVEDSLAAPLGLGHTSYCWNAPLVPGRAEGYAASDSLPGRGKLGKPVLVNAGPLSMKLPGAAGALCSTVGDLVRWTRLLHAGKVVSPASFRAMTTPATLPDGLSTHYGFGLFMGELGGHRYVWHNGGINGFLTSVARYPDDDLTVVVLSNSTSVGPDRLQAEIARYALGIPAPPSEPEPLPGGLAGRVAGTYRMVANGARIVVSAGAEGDSLTATAEGLMGPRPVPLTYVGGAGSGQAEFLLGPPSGPRLVFGLPATGRGPARHVTFRAGLAEIEGLRVEGGGGSAGGS
ncbi:MAG TPA: serine hydrolase domain-containing protein, partial [Gemmatimonadota bacterium]|nr:serine hydrolase domain-containing protein [Gemmatimonadota bacterium]